MSQSPLPIDLAQLARYTGGEAALDAEVLGLFRDQCTETVRDLQMLLRDPDPRAWRERAHKLKGGALAVGASQVAALAARAERLDASAAPVEAAEIVGALAEVCRLVETFVNGRITR